MICYYTTVTLEKKVGCYGRAYRHVALGPNLLSHNHFFHAIIVFFSGWSVWLPVWSSRVPLCRCHPQLASDNGPWLGTRQADDHYCASVYAWFSANDRQLCTRLRFPLRLYAVLCSSAVRDVRIGRRERKDHRDRCLSSRLCLFTQRTYCSLLCFSDLQLHWMPVFQLHSFHGQVLSEHGSQNRARWRFLNLILLYVSLWCCCGVVVLLFGFHLLIIIS